MPDTDLIRAFTWIDWVIVLVVIVCVFNGASRGFVGGVTDLVGLAFATATAFLTYRFAAEILSQWLPLPPTLTLAAGFLAALLTVRLAFGLAISILSRGFRPLTRTLRPLAFVNRLLGIVPGAMHGLLLAGLFVLLVAVAPFPLGLQPAIARSPLGSQLLAKTLESRPLVESALGTNLELIPHSVSLTTADELIPLDVSARGPVSVDEIAESTMLRLLNEERAREGLSPLVLDPALRDVARAHSRDMFEQGYFAHNSPITGSPSDRLSKAGVPYRVAGENLAYAPTVELAHQGLMNSPGHRANILRPHFGRVGIGAIRSAWRGTMFSQEFAD